MAGANLQDKRGAWKNRISPLTEFHRISHQTDRISHQTDRISPKSDVRML